MKRIVQLTGFAPLAGLMLLIICSLCIGCSVPWTSIVDEYKVPITGAPIPLFTDIIISTESSCFSGSFEYCKTGDYRSSGKHKISSESFSFCLDDVLVEQLSNSARLAFTKECWELESADNAQKYFLTLKFKPTNINAEHNVEDSGTRSQRTVVPKNVYVVHLNGELEYNFLCPDKATTVVSGSTYSDGTGKGYQVGLLSGDTGIYGSFRGALKAAYISAINESCIKLVNSLRASNEVAAIARKEIEKRTLAANLMVKPRYSDKSSLLPNNTIDAGEQSTITATVTNEGKGTAFDVKLHTNCDYKNIEFPETIPV
ncbi:MAG: hypothetical protein ABIF87_18310, partial [Pseudomonadota bacterium]